MTTTNPIVPPPELVQQWLREHYGAVSVAPGEATSHVATQAARWGADMELEACCQSVKRVPSPLGVPFGVMASNALRAARRPKPPSLKEQALAALEALPTPAGQVTTDRFDTIRRALEALDD